jgi:hypothetical protein
MAYVHEVRFSVPPGKMTELEIGGSLEKVLGYLKTLLPSEPGFITARAMASVKNREQVNLVFQSVWEKWEDLQHMEESGLAEEKVLREFGPHLKREHLAIEVYQEVP